MSWIVERVERLKKKVIAKYVLNRLLKWYLVQTWSNFEQVWLISHSLSDIRQPNSVNWPPAVFNRLQNSLAPVCSWKWLGTSPIYNYIYIYGTSAEFRQFAVSVGTRDLLFDRRFRMQPISVSAEITLRYVRFVFTVVLVSRPTSSYRICLTNWSSFLALLADLDAPNSFFHGR